LDKLTRNPFHLHLAWVVGDKSPLEYVKTLLGFIRTQFKGFPGTDPGFHGAIPTGSFSAAIPPNSSSSSGDINVNKKTAV
jgi:hypothetical protein